MRYPAAWVVTSEYNYDVAERSFYLDTSAKPLGAFSPSFLSVIAGALRKTLRDRRGRVNRSL
jgi:hypothetical protein